VTQLFKCEAPRPYLAGGTPGAQLTSDSKGKQENVTFIYIVSQ